MRKVNREEFIRLPAGTLFSEVDCGDNYRTTLFIKTDTGDAYDNLYTGGKSWGFVGVMPLAPDIPADPEEGYITKYLGDYKYNEHIKGEWSINDTSSADYDDEDEFIIYDEEDIKFMIKLLQTWCIDKNLDDEEIDKVIE